MKRTVTLFVILCVSSLSSSEDVVKRWADAVGGREKIAAIKSIYREATIEFGPYRGTLKVWHTADGKYRKEEQVATLSTVETFDGTTGYVQQGSEPPRRMTDAETQQTRSRRFANSNAMFFVFFPDRHRGAVKTEQDGTIVFVPEGGIEWRVTLDPQTSLPRTMVHKEGERTVTATFDSYEVVDGIKLEKELHRSAGNPGMTSVIHFTKTVINPPLDPSLFTKIDANPSNDKH